MHQRSLIQHMHMMHGKHLRMRMPCGVHAAEAGSGIAVMCLAAHTPIICTRLLYHPTWQPCCVLKCSLCKLLYSASNELFSVR